MRVLIAHNDYARFSGEEAAVNNIATVLATNGHDVSWLRRSSVGIDDSVMSKANALAAGIYSYKSRDAVRDLLSSEQIDVAQVQNLYPRLSASILPALRKARVPVVMRCPNYRLFCPTGLHLRNGKVCELCLSGLREWNCVRYNCASDPFKSIGYAARNAFGRLSGMIADNVNVFIVLTEFQRARFIAAGVPRAQIETLPNPAPVSNGSAGSYPGEYVGFAGRVSEEKGFHDVLFAARALPHVPFKIAGAIDRPLTIEDIPKNVELMGFLDQKQIRTLISGSRLMVFPSRWFEGFPNAVVESMALGKAVVASRIGGIPEIVDEGTTGLLVGPGNGEELAQKILSLWSDPAQAAEMGLAGRRKAKEAYSIESFYERLIRIYRKAISSS